MKTLQNKIDFAVVVAVKNANPNGDPLNGNRPRVTIDGYGEISDVCLKRKIRNRLQDMGDRIFVQCSERSDDGCSSLSERLRSNELLAEASKNKDVKNFTVAACETWMDVRAFGQVFAFKGDAVSVGIRGPVTVQPAFSVLPVDVESTQITKSVNGETKEGKSSDTMGMKHRIASGLYVFNGSISPQLAELTGFSEDDAIKIKEALRTLFVGDESSARPAGSMEVVKVIWWEHDCKHGQYSAAKVHRLVDIAAKCDDPRGVNDYEIKVHPLDGLKVEEIDGI